MNGINGMNSFDGIADITVRLKPTTLWLLDRFKEHRQAMQNLQGKDLTREYEETRSYACQITQELLTAMGDRG